MRSNTLRLACGQPLERAGRACTTNVFRIRLIRRKTAGSFLRLRTEFAVSLNAKNALKLLDLSVGKRTVIEAVAAVRFGRVIYCGLFDVPRFFFHTKLFVRAVIVDTPLILACVPLCAPLCLLYPGNVLVPKSILLVGVSLIVEVAVVNVLAVVEASLGIVSARSIIALCKPLVVAVHITPVFLLLLCAEHSILIVKLLTLHIVAIECHSIKFGNNVIELREVRLISLIAGGGSVGVSVAARQSRCLTHSVLHSELAEALILLRVHFVERV